MSTRAKCSHCSATYDPEWIGTTCSVCDGDILPLETVPMLPPSMMERTFSKFRQDLRKLLYEHGVKSSPDWAEDDIITAFRELLNKTGAQ